MLQLQLVELEVVQRFPKHSLGQRLQTQPDPRRGLLALARQL